MPDNAMPQPKGNAPCHPDKGPSDYDDPPSIFSLPTEIFFDIVAVGKQAAEEDEGTRNSLKAYQLSISQTSQFFRQIALHSPLIWTSIFVAATTKVDWLAHCLKGSGHHPLDIHLELERDDPITHVVHLNHVLDIMAHASHRWKTLTIKSAFEHAANPIVRRLCSHQAPVLEHLAIHVDDTDCITSATFQEYVYGNVNRPHIFQNDAAPNLKSVHLRDKALLAFRPPVKAVVTLRLEDRRHTNIPYVIVRQLMIYPAFLTHLWLDGELIGQHGDAWPGRTDIIEMPRLRWLRLRSITHRMYPGILLGLETPSLGTLILEDTMMDDLQPLWDFARPDRYAKLHHLELINADLHFSCPMMKTFLNITSFSDSTVTCSRSRIAGMLIRGPCIRTAEEEEGTFIRWPHLKHMTFKSSGTEDESGRVVKLAKARMAIGLPLSSIRLGSRVYNSEGVLVAM
ncbi:hypothetical protein D9613_009815 [Agrocybe pediades]|uniref:F-box domain-containing protein n=1 Tax=Agrocybe pediades TaxID=84607 RepID=A0A8H4QWR6_9AGAR|nr:hypothetical protein D9613_009815 [Agrocybe pediades]